MRALASARSCSRALKSPRHQAKRLMDENRSGSVDRCVLTKAQPFSPKLEELLAERCEFSAGAIETGVALFNARALSRRCDTGWGCLAAADSGCQSDAD
jgi:hypothetical protein